MSKRVCCYCIRNLMHALTYLGGGGVLRGCGVCYNCCVLLL